MKFLGSPIRRSIALISLAVASPSFAQATLVKSTPAPKSTASNVKALTLTFSSAIDGSRSGAEIVMTSMPGMTNHTPMKVTGFKSSLASDGKTLSLDLPRNLPTGTYELSWHTVTRDGRRMEGRYTFAVK